MMPQRAIMMDGKPGARVFRKPLASANSSVAGEMLAWRLDVVLTLVSSSLRGF